MLVADSVADATAFDKWRWGSLTSVIDVNDGVMDKSNTLMCKAHKEGKKYGFFGKYSCVTFDSLHKYLPSKLYLRKI